MEIPRRNKDFIKTQKNQYTPFALSGNATQSLHLADLSRKLHFFDVGEGFNR